MIYTNGIKFNKNVVSNIADFEQLKNINNALVDNQKNILTCCEEVSEIIKNRPNKKSFGSDKIPYFVIKKFSANFILFLATLFNHLLAISYFPEIWKTAKVTPIPKPGRDIQIISNWRPISNLFSISKIFEKIILQRLIDDLNDKNIFEWQFGFRKYYSTIHPLSFVQNDIADGLNGGNFTSLISLDLKSAFDTVWKNGLLFKMINLNVNNNLCHMIDSFLSNRKFFVALDSSISNIKKMDFGLPQGSCLSPFLFNIYVHDLPRNDDIKCIQYADDILLYHTGRDVGIFQNKINILLVDLAKWFRNWKLKINENKTVWINVIGSRNDVEKRIRRTIKNIPICFNGFYLRPVYQMKYLGIIFDEKNNFNCHIKNIIQKSNGA